jgi:hypothetical protein
MTQKKASNPKDLLAESESRVAFALIPSTALIHLAMALADGARKYGEYNWRDEGVGAMTYVSAAERHLRDWLDGEESAADSKVHHLGHAMACLAIILDAQEIGNLVDNRPPAAPTSEMMECVKENGAAGLAHRPTGFEEGSYVDVPYTIERAPIHYDADAARAYRQRLREEYDLD